MRKSVLVLAVLAAGLSSAAVAKDVKQSKAAVSGPAQLTDAELDRVVAGEAGTGTHCVTDLGCQSVGGPTDTPRQNNNGFNGYQNGGSHAPAERPGPGSYFVPLSAF